MELLRGDDREDDVLHPGVPHKPFVRPRGIVDNANVGWLKIHLHIQEYTRGRCLWRRDRLGVREKRTRARADYTRYHPQKITIVRSFEARFNDRLSRC
jgi:hypothetical protein